MREIISELRGLPGVQYRTGRQVELSAALLDRIARTTEGFRRTAIDTLELVLASTEGNSPDRTRLSPQARHYIEAALAKLREED